MNNSYKNARIKLTILYFFIIFFTICVYSIIVLREQNRQFEKFDRIKNLNGQVIIRQNEKITAESISKVETIIEEIKQENLKAVIILDTFMLAGTSFLAYFLSGKTLQPILETLNKQKRFISDASHELKTPLTNIRTEAEVLYRSKNSNIDEFKTFTKDVIEETYRLNDLVSYLLETARLENQPTTINKERINISEILKTSTKEFEERAKVKKISINLNLEEDEIYAETDKIHLKRIISALIDNSIKYNKPEGEITIKAFLNKSKQTIIEIKDTGIGISEENLYKIFDRFFRVSEDRNEKGFGLGLSIVKQLTNELNIKIEVKSKINEGTEFRLTI